ncbi:MAG: divalent-cation tolerance protein CutA [Planctomycetota bacterium]|nr:MAG: divalent-cation tolerance protein CutA [Planctomycetota bacterium]
MTGVLQVVTTVDSKQQADKLAEALVARRLAACVQVSGPITSTYHWQGKVESGEEWICAIKSLSAKYKSLEQAIVELHPYDVPEILAFDVVAGHRGYLDWLAAELGGGPEQRPA